MRNEREIIILSDAARAKAHPADREQAARQVAEALARLTRVASVELWATRPDVIEQAILALEAWEAVQ